MSEESVKRVKQIVKEQDKVEPIEPVNPPIRVQSIPQHFAISTDDIVKLQEAVNNAINILGQGFGVKRIDFEVMTGEDYMPLEVCGYWFGNILRIDVEVKK